MNLGAGTLTVNNASSGISGGSVSSSYQYIGSGGTGALGQSGGANTVTNALYLGSGTGSSGTYTLSGNGLLSVASGYVGNSGSGTFTQSGGTHAVTGSLYLGYGAGSVGTYALSGSGLLSAPSGYIGNSGAGAFTQSGGTAITTSLYLGYSTGSGGAYALSGSGLLSASFAYVGSSGSGTFTQSGGTDAITSLLYLGYSGGSNGGYTLSDGLLSAFYACVGNSGSGTFTQSGGTDAIANSLRLGYYAGSSGKYNLNGGLLVLSSLIGSGSASFNFSGGTMRAGGSFSTALPLALNTAGGNATIDTAGYTVTLSGLLSGPGSLIKSGDGPLVLAASNNYTGATTISAGILTLANSAALAGGGALTFAGGTLQYSGSNSQDYSGRIVGSPGPISIDTNGMNVTFASALDGSNSGGLTKTGSGTLLLANTSTYTGPTMVNQGELIVNGAVTSPVTVNSGGTLGGAGSLGSVAVNAGGHLAPGNSPGVMSLNGSLSLASGAVMDYELDLPDDSDEIYMPAGLMVLSGQQFSDFNFTPLAGFGMGKYTLIDAGSVDGSLGPALDGTIDGLPAILAVEGNDMVLNVVPEPSTLVLAAAAAGLVACTRRRISRMCKGTARDFKVSLCALVSSTCRFPSSTASKSRASCRFEPRRPAATFSAQSQQARFHSSGRLTGCVGWDQIA